MTNLDQYFMLLSHRCLKSYQAYPKAPLYAGEKEQDLN